MLSDIVNVSVSTQSVGPQQAGFGEMLILSAEASAMPLVQHFTSLAGLASASFATTGPTYKAASAAFSQNPAPVSVAVGKLTHLPTQHFTVTPIAVSNSTYTVTVDGVAASCSPGASPTLATVCTQIASAINALSITGLTASGASGTNVTITVATAGAWHNVVPSGVGTLMDFAMDAAATGQEAADLNSIALYDSSWYGIVNLFGSAAINTAIAAWTEANKKFFIADSQDTLVADQALHTGTDVAQTLQTAGYARTGVAFHPDNGQFLSAAWQGSRLPMQPGSENWMFASLAGVSAVSLTASQVTNLKAKNANYYYAVVTGLNITAQGTTASGSYFDLTRGQDWLVSRLSTRIVTILATTNAKIPYTDQGVSIILDQVRAQMQEGIDAGYLASLPAPVVSAPLVANANPNDVLNRILRGVTFSAVAQGAINNVNITGTVLL